MIMIEHCNQLIQDSWHPNPTVILKNMLSSKNCIQTLEFGPEEFWNHANQGRKKFLKIWETYHVGEEK